MQKADIVLLGNSRFCQLTDFAALTLGKKIKKVYALAPLGLSKKQIGEVPHLRKFFKLEPKTQRELSQEAYDKTLVIRSNHVDYIVGAAPVIGFKPMSNIGRVVEINTSKKLSHGVVNYIEQYIQRGEPVDEKNEHIIKRIEQKEGHSFISRKNLNVNEMKNNDSLRRYNKIERGRSLLSKEPKPLSLDKYGPSSF